MSTTAVGFVLTICLVACVAAVLTAMADIARDTPQGGSVAVPTRMDWTIPARATVRAPAPGYVGRHRRE